MSPLILVVTNEHGRHAQISRIAEQSDGILQECSYTPGEPLSSLGSLGWQCIVLLAACHVHHASTSGMA